MKINEVRGQDMMSLNVKKWKSIQDVIKFLRANGYKKIGKGAFATIYARSKTDDKIVKISKKGDFCWLHYAVMCQTLLKTKPNPYIPRIQSVVRVDNKTNNPAIISIIERLEPIDGRKFLETLQTTTNAKEFVKIYSVLTAADMQPFIWPVELPRYKAYPELEKMFANTKEMAEAIHPRVGVINALHQKVSRDPLVKFGKEIQRNAPSNCSNDMHDGNIMIRPGTDTYVITDPLADMDYAWK